MKVRTRLFNKQYPLGKLFLIQEEVDQAMAEGWVDAKHKVGESSQIDRNDKENVIKSTDLIKLCECGCGTPVKNRFVQGHSWKSKGKKNGDSQDDK